MNDGRNTFGQAYALTVLLPITRGREASLARLLQAIDTAERSPLADVPGTHFARWVIVDDVVYQGGQQRRDHLSRSRLLFTSNHDGDPHRYLDGLRAGLGDAGHAIWSHCDGYPGVRDGRAFAAYLRGHQVEAELFFAAYGARTVEEVIRSLATRRRVTEFALEAQGLEATELQRRFIEAFPR